MLRLFKRTIKKFKEQTGSLNRVTNSSRIWKHVSVLRNVLFFLRERFQKSNESLLLRGILWLCLCWGGDAESKGSRAFYQKRAEGWHWYERAPKKEQGEEEILSEENPSKPSLTPTQEVEALKKELNDLLNKAILYPTPENVIQYKRKQEAFMEQSHEFARTWQRVTFENPDLDYTLKFPTQHSGRLIYRQEEGRAKDKVLRELSQDYGLFYIFRSDCRYCEAFAPLVQGFSKKYGWDVLAISADGGHLKEFPNAQINNGIIENLKIDTFPALIAVHPTSNKIIPLAYGMTSLSDIETRAYQLVDEKRRRQQTSIHQADTFGEKP